MYHKVKIQNGKVLKP